jgi:uncharacterized protein (TIGR02147 family)
MNGSTAAMNIYEYDDYRLFLRDKYDQKKAADPSYSARKFASEASITNPGFLNDVIKARRTLSDDATEKMIKVFELTPIEAEFFKLLVEYRQTKNPQHRQELYKQIVFRRNRSLFVRLNPSLAKYYQDYRYPLLRAAIMATDFRGDYEHLGHFVIPPVPASMVKKYIRDLCDWGLVTQDTNGKYSVTSDFIEPPRTLSDLVKQINREWIIQSLEALIKLGADKRHISTMLLSVSGDLEKKITEKIEKFREEIWAMVKETTDQPDRIMQLNIQYFPKSITRDR